MLGLKTFIKLELKFIRWRRILVDSKELIRNMWLRLNLSIRWLNQKLVWL